MTAYTYATDLREEYEDICDAMSRDRNEEVCEDSDDEYRDERDGAERLADRHNCWCNNTARYILCATIYTAL